ncbi:MAG: flagellar motor switch protein FliN [Deltaproteobacteria bacterium]|nr:flagellar motor switch protein FliN [Deltaproteobacteria bacterium]
MEQSEIDAMLKNVDVSDTPDNPPKDDNDLQWDDVEMEMERSRTGKPTIEVSPASFEETSKGESPKPTLDMDFILDIPLALTVELGRNRMLIGELLQLGQGSVIELSKLAGEPMDVFINQRLMARGEVVVVNEKFGVRLTDIVSPADRINKLK